QNIPKNTHHQEQLPYAMPFRMALLADDGSEYPLVSERVTLLHNDVLWLEEGVSEIVFKEIPTKPRLSLNRGFSAPIIVQCDELDFPFLMAHERDGFVRYEAAHQFGIETLEAMMAGAEVKERYIESYGAILADRSIEEMFKSQILELPSMTTLMQRQETINVALIAKAQEKLKYSVAKRYFNELLQMLNELYDPSNARIDGISMGKRALKNRVLGLLMCAGDESIYTLCLSHYHEAHSMSERLAALDLLENYAPDLAVGALEHFYARYSDQTLVMNKYFVVRASSRREGTLQRVKELQNDSAYDKKVPNLVRSLIGSFARNPVAFYDVSGEGFAFVADKVIEIDELNPQIASGLAGAFKNYGRLGIEQKTQMGCELERIKNHPNLSNNVYEIVSKILEA
ncbi:DUF3458 domain-containing protein, partial [Sulfuricurvum sp.]|uniref:DUF3458 domain-containing protein n=1 Tax=Sulfuricurvum sp. TaxID=2025608 RepID=UPI002E311AFA